MGKGSLIGRVVRGDWNGGFDLACGGHVVGIFVLVVGESELEGGGGDVGVVGIGTGLLSK